MINTANLQMTKILEAIRTRAAVPAKDGPRPRADGAPQSE